MKFTLALVFTLCLHQFVFAQNQAVSIYNSDSTLMGTGVMTNGRMDGLWKFVNPKTGALIQEGLFEKGQKNGTWIVYHPNKKRKIEAEYKDGQLSAALKKTNSMAQCTHHGSIFF